MSYPASSATTSPPAWYKLPANYGAAQNAATPFTPKAPIPNLSGGVAGANAIPAILNGWPIVFGFGQ